MIYFWALLSLSGVVVFLVIVNWRGYNKAFVVAVSMLGAFCAAAGIISFTFQSINIGGLAIFGCQYFFIWYYCSSVSCPYFYLWHLLLLILGQLLLLLLLRLSERSTIPLVAIGKVALNFKSSVVGEILGTIVIAIAIILLCASIARQALAGNKNYRIVRDVAIALVARLGTCFREANLKGSNFSQATVKNADFYRANLDLYLLVQR